MRAPLPKSPRRKRNYTSPPHSPSLSLSGLERPVPRTSPLSQTSFPLRPTPPETRSYDSKPLPETPLAESPATRPTSSIYSQIDETLRFIESYGADDEEWRPSSTGTQTHAQQSYFPQQDSKGKAPTYLSSRSYSDRSPQWTEKSLLASASASVHSSNIAPSQRSLPTQLAQDIGPTPRQKANKLASHNSLRKKAPPSDINVADSFDSIPYDSTFGHFPIPVSPRITDVIDHSLVPRPLNLRASTRTTDVIDHSLLPRPLNPRASTRISAESSQPLYDSVSKPSRQPRSEPAKSPPKTEDISTSFFDLSDLEDNNEIHSHFSRTSSSDSSWVLRHSFTGHFMTAIKDVMRPKSKEKRKQKEQEGVMSNASAMYPQMTPYGRDPSSSSEIPRSSGFRRESQSLWMGSRALKNAIYDAARKSSISSSGDSKSRKSSIAEPSQPKRREKTLAIPTSPYQRYGAKIWEAPKKEKKTNPKTEKLKSKLWRSSWRAQPTMKELRAEAVRERRISAPLLSQHHFDRRGGPGQKAKDREREREEKEEKRKPPSALQHGSKEVALAFDRLMLKRSIEAEEKRKAKLKASIKLIGPSDQFADGRVNHWL